MQSSIKKTSEERLRQVIEDPFQFSKKILGHNIWSKQEEILRSVADHPRTAVKACHASGKTFTAAELAIWWVTSHKNGIAVTTAPTMTQVERLLWGEIRKAISTSKID